MVAWIIVAIQSIALLCALLGHVRQLMTESAADLYHLSVNGKPYSYHHDDNRNLGSYESPIVYPVEAGLVSRVWHSNASPQINSEAHSGSCWCSVDSFCMCTPSLAIDLILTSGSDVWLIQRAKEGIPALIGGFNEVGETVEDASRREMKEEIGLELPDHPLNLVGVYSDPKRDARKHSVSVVFHMEIPDDVTPVAGDDAKQVIRFPLEDVEKIETMWADHKTILLDFIKKQRETQDDDRPKELERNEVEVKRSVCPL